MIFIFIVYFINPVLITGKIYEISRASSMNFLQSKILFQTKYEESRETIETKRELCLDEYRLYQRRSLWRPRLSSICENYCNTTMDCQQNQEPSACTNPSWPTRNVKYVQKYKRICYIRITEISRYKKAERMCRKYGLQLAIIDNIPLLERLRQVKMFNLTCKGQCAKRSGYYIGLRRSESKWIWSNNVTWTQNEIDCDDYFHTSYPNSSLLCYIGQDGQKKVTVWNQNEPNYNETFNYQTGERCVEIIVHSNRNMSLEKIGKLNDIPCTKPTFGALCQVEGNSVLSFVKEDCEEGYILDSKPFQSTQFESYASIIGFNTTETIYEKAFADMKTTIAPNLDIILDINTALEELLVEDLYRKKEATTILNIIDQLVNVTGQIKVENDSLKSITNKLLQYLDLFAAKIQIENTEYFSFQFENMNLSIFDINFENQTNQWFNLNKDDQNPHTIIEINIPNIRKQLFQSNNHRIIQTVFSNFNLFPQTNITNIGVPISYQIANSSPIKTDGDLIKFKIRIPKLTKSSEFACVYWSFDKNNGSWIADDGCRFAGLINNYAECYCNHLTHFTVLMISGPEHTLEALSRTEEFILTFVTYIGISLSILGLVVTLITYILFRNSKKSRSHTSLIMLCLSILFVNCFYIPFSLHQSNLSKLNLHMFCTVLGFLFHYFFIASFMWMLIMAIVQYVYFVQIINTHISHFYLKSCTLGWIVPLIFPSIVVVLGANGGYTGEARCWINNQTLLNFTFLTPISIIILFNLILFGFILKSIFNQHSPSARNKKKYSKFQIGATLCCFVSIGCTWLFGFIVLIDPSFNLELIFSICNSFQGFLIFLFHVYLSKPKRALWQKFFVNKRIRSSTTLPPSPKDIVTISYSSSRHPSGITGSYRSNFSSTTTLSKFDQHKMTNENGSKRNELLNVEQLQLHRLSTETIRTT